MNIYNNDNIITIKAVLLGSSETGKSSIAIRFMKNIFYKSSCSTIGGSFFTKNINTNYGKFELNLWDTAGQESFDSLMPLYYRGAQLVLIVFDITNKNSYIRSQYWVKKLRKDYTLEPFIILIGNKLDIAENRVITKSEIIKYACEHNILYYETSALLDVNITELFYDGIKGVYDNIIIDKNQNNNNINLTTDENTKSYNLWSCFGLLVKNPEITNVINT